MKHQKSLVAFERLLEIMDILREKCPWDKKQTFQSLRQLTIEEIYELSDAILQEDVQEMKKELGDVFLHLVFYAKIASETNQFSLDEVLNSICDKLIHRHPHIYGNVHVEDENEVKQNWEKLKLQEGKKSVLEGVPLGLPAMIKAYRIQEKVKGVGFEFDHSSQVIDKIKEEIQEFEQETNQEKRELEFGDVMFSLINYARFTGINPENALEKTNKKFIKRFQKMEEIAKENHQILHELNLEELDELWKIVKQFD
jgi:XTP/dITP diphosphohydrolase